MASKQQFKITLPTGEKGWVCGETVSEAFINFAKTYGGLFADAEQPQKKSPRCSSLWIKLTVRPSSPG